MTFLLIYVVYAVAIAQPGHGSLGPLAIGLTLYVAESAGERAELCLNCVIANCME